jgi:hypothetical protein
MAPSNVKEEDFGPVGRSVAFGSEEAPDNRPHVHVHLAAGGKKAVVAAQPNVPASRKATGTVRLRAKRGS